MQRNEWEFEYGASELAAAAAAKANHHASRAKWWELKKEEVMRTVRESGIDVTESVAAGNSARSTGFGPQIIIDATLQRKLQECHAKINEHTAKVRDYEGWRQ